MDLEISRPRAVRGDRSRLAGPRCSVRWDCSWAASDVTWTVPERQGRQSSGFVHDGVLWLFILAFSSVDCQPTPHAPRSPLCSASPSVLLHRRFVPAWFLFLAVLRSPALICFPFPAAFCAPVSGPLRGSFSKPRDEMLTRACACRRCAGRVYSSRCRCASSISRPTRACWWRNPAPED